MQAMCSEKINLKIWHQTKPLFAESIQIKKQTRRKLSEPRDRIELACDQTAALSFGVQRHQ